MFCRTIVEYVLNIGLLRNNFSFGWKVLYMELPHDVSQSLQKVIVLEKTDSCSGSGSRCGDLPRMHLRSGEEAGERIHSSGSDEGAWEHHYTADWVPAQHPPDR